MEMVLNRLKSEFSFARRMYFEYLTGGSLDELRYESCFSELFNDEILGGEVEKIRVGFRQCFSILDKIAVAVCELFDVYPKNRVVFFQSFWQLHLENRMETFESIKSPGLLALYSIATDLNEKGSGEWAFLKDWRNDLEHKFVIVHKGEKPSDVYGSYKMMNDMLFINEADFIYHYKHLLQLTRSAIFSFVFVVREKALKQKAEGGVYLPNIIQRQNFTLD